MIIKECKGYELKKEKPNTSEDFFNRSEVTYLQDGKEQTLHVLYVRYFEEQISAFTPFKEDPVFTAGNRDVFFKEIVAIVCLLKNPGLTERKRIYINAQREFQAIFEGIDFSKLPIIFQKLEENQSYELQSPRDFFQS
ncbi:hypothetical protein ACE38V_03905 [Cytobacillus sp. Hz8]|uniref:hypothetical protein n=1 Tax=Cytobacillus sp. Hz8 TaxID=3347168 RepID=UPI0035DE3ABA